MLCGMAGSMSRSVSRSLLAGKPGCTLCSKALRSDTCQRNRCRPCCAQDPLYVCGNAYHNKCRSELASFASASGSAPAAPPSAPAPSTAVQTTSASPTPATPTLTSPQSTPSNARPPANPTSSTYANPLHPLWTHNNALGAAILQAHDEQRVIAAAVKGRGREERDMVLQKTVDIQLWVEVCGWLVSRLPTSAHTLLL